MKKIAVLLLSFALMGCSGNHTPGTTATYDGYRVYRLDDADSICYIYSGRGISCIAKVKQ